LHLPDQLVVLNNLRKSKMTHENNGHSTRKAYQAMRISQLGSLAELTQMMATGAFNDMGLAGPNMLMMNLMGYGS
jgi:hypothetical protein